MSEVYAAMPCQPDLADGGLLAAAATGQGRLFGLVRRPGTLGVPGPMLAGRLNGP